jgi:Fe(3+) dicitrate transport protein
MRFILLSIIALAATKLATAQKTTPPDTASYLIPKTLPDVTVVGKGSKQDYQQMPEIVGTNIYAGKKSNLIVLDNVQGNVVNNNMRQILAKVPGIHVWESDPSGLQVGIAARGLSPNRSWEFNTRQNGFDIAADPFGYPEAYYNPQMQAVQRIEVVRGQGALQYGPQFGGMVNYILRNGSDINKKFELETHQTRGSNGLFNSYNAIGGKTNKIHYYSFLDHRNGNGYRANSKFYSNVAFGTITYKPSNKVNITAELTTSHTRSQQPGGLTDAQMNNIVQSFRTRNWFDLKWTLPSVSVDYKINATTRWITKLNAIIGNRNSVGYLQPINFADSIVTATGQYNNRAVNIDLYRNYALESRFITDYNLGSFKNTLSVGMRLYTGKTYRRTNGKGTTGSNYDVTTIGDYLTDITFTSKNAAVFVENIFRIGKKLLLIPGVRVEYLKGTATGKNGLNSGGGALLIQNIKRNRTFALLGFGAEYHATKNTEVYANISQAYRPIQFANLQAPPTTDIIDEDLKDAKGYNFDIGYRGTIKNFLTFDVSTFVMQYNNRVGNYTLPGTTTRFVTNVGNSTSKGFEAIFDASLLKALAKNSNYQVNIFGSYAYNDARYSGNYKVATLQNKKLENAPQHILRTGIGIGYKKVLITTQYSYTSAMFADANNTELPNTAATVGTIPSYNVVDVTASFTIKTIACKAGLNNAFNKTYFTRRAGGYPGPGALPADGRTFFITLSTKF